MEKGCSHMEKNYALMNGSTRGVTQFYGRGKAHSILRGKSLDMKYSNNCAFPGNEAIGL